MILSFGGREGVKWGNSYICLYSCEYCNNFVVRVLSVASASVVFVLEKENETESEKEEDREETERVRARELNVHYVLFINKEHWKIEEVRFFRNLEWYKHSKKRSSNWALNQKLNVYTDSLSWDIFKKFSKNCDKTSVNAMYIRKGTSKETMYMHGS